MTQDEFFRWQEKQETLYELARGIPVTPLKKVIGASQAHDRVTVNIIGILGNQLRHGPCCPTTDNLAVRIPCGNVRRPDIAIECGCGTRHDLAVTEPRMVIEVLSPGTIDIERIRKVYEYQSIETLGYVLLVDTEAPCADLLSRDADGRWVQSKYDGLDARIDLPAIQASLKLADVFEGLDFDAPPAGAG